MLDKINRVLKNIEISKIRQINQKASKYSNVINLTLGEPHFQTPDVIKEKAIEGINHNFTKYTPNKGDKLVLENLIRYTKERLNLEYSTDEIIATVGVTEGLSIIFKTILEPNDHVLIPSPTFPGYPPLIKLNNATPVFINTEKDNFQLTVDNLKRHITDKTKCILLNYPNNPTGISLNKRNVKDLANFLMEKDIFILLDEVYNKIIFSDFFSLSSYSKLKEKLIIVNGLSKSHSMTGWRIGFVLASKDLIAEMTKVHQYFVTSTSSISQYATLSLLDCNTTQIVSELKRNIDYAYNKLVNLGFQCIKPNGGFYLFPKVSSFGLNGEQFTNKLLDEKQVAVVPGNGFNKDFVDYIRITCACGIDELKEAFERIEDFTKDIKKGDLK